MSLRVEKKLIISGINQSWNGTLFVSLKDKVGNDYFIETKGNLYFEINKYSINKEYLVSFIVKKEITRQNKKYIEIKNVKFK